MRHQDYCRRCAGGPKARAKAKAEAEKIQADIDLRKHLSKQPNFKRVEHNLADGILDEIFWVKGMTEFLRHRVQEEDPEALVWGLTEHSDKTGGEDWGVRNVEKAGPNTWLRLYIDNQKLYADLVFKAKAAEIDDRRIQLAERYADRIVVAFDMVLSGVLASLVKEGWDKGELEEVWDGIVVKVVPEALKELEA